MTVEQREYDKNVLALFERTDDVSTGQLFPGSAKRSSGISRIMEPLRTILETQGFRFAILTGESINQVDRRINLQTGIEGGFLYEVCPPVEIAFCAEPNRVLLPNTAFHSAAEQERLLSQHFTNLLGIMNRLQRRRCSARDLVELDTLFQQATGRGLFEENSGLSTSYTISGKRICVGRYGLRLQVHATPPQNGLSDVLGCFVLSAVDR